MEGEETGGGGGVIPLISVVACSHMTLALVTKDAGTVPTGFVVVDLGRTATVALVAAVDFVCVCACVCVPEDEHAVRMRPVITTMMIGPIRLCAYCLKIMYISLKGSDDITCWEFTELVDSPATHRAILDQVGRRRV